MRKWREYAENEFRDRGDFFYDNPEIAEKYGLVTCMDREPIGFVTWDPRNRLEYVEIGQNGIREKYKRQGYGHRQLEEAVRRIKEYEGLKRIIVCRRNRRYLIASNNTSNLINCLRNVQTATFIVPKRKIIARIFIPSEQREPVTEEHS